ncbi:MAG: hypothetical protein WCA35_28080 [Kovacikia sp.]
MSLPFVVDVAVGLLFIYLILSLLASELQELLTTLLQWRARHLKDAIEILLAGGTDSKEQEQVKDLVDKIYNDPLLKNMNQEAKGLITGGFRTITRWLIPGNRKGGFGKNLSTGPSYIAPESFATSLMNSLGISVLSEKLTEVRLEKFANRIVGFYTPQEQGSPEIPADESLRGDWERGGVRLIAEKVGLRSLNTDEKFKTLVEDYDDILKDYKNGQADLETCIARMGHELDEYLNACASLEAEELGVESTTAKDYFLRRLRSFKLGLFGEANERAILSGGLRPNAYEVAELTNQGSKIYKELADAYETLTTRAGTIADKVDAEITNRLREENPNLDTPLTLQDLNNEQRQLYLNQALLSLINRGELTYEDRKTYENYQSYQEIKQVLSKIPQPIKNSLETLAKRAHSEVGKTENYVHQFRKEVALWFDRSMARSSGVYKRNAKGVTILIGIVLAAITNSDSFFIADRLSSDENLRKVVTDRAAQLTTGSTTPLSEQDLEELKAKADNALRDLTLPIGWEAPNLIRQFRCESSVPSSSPSAQPPASNPGSNSTSVISSVVSRSEERKDLRQACLGTQASSNTPVVLQLILAKPLEFLRRLGGWLVTGIAISMGAPFWFDLLGKIMNVRNSGSKPAPMADQPSSK